MSHLKGVATIQLFDAETGELQQEIKEENMVTNAVEECLNLPDYMATGLDLNEDRSKRMVSYRNSIADNFFNGVLIYRDTIEENADKIIPPFDNPEVGHAGDTTAAVLDHQGTYNTVESGAITNGIRRVWDFATDRANGKISCVCLTSRAGGTVGEWRQQEYQMGGNNFTSSTSSTASLESILNIKRNTKGDFSSSLHNMQIFYMEQQENGEIRLLAKGMDSAVTEIILGDPFKQKLFSYSNEIQSVKTIFTAGTTSTIWYDWYNEGGERFPDGRGVEAYYAEALKKNITEKSLYSYFSPYVYQNKIHIIYPLCNKGGANALRHIILNLQTYAVEQDKTVMLERAPYLKVSQSYNSESDNPPAHKETLEDGEQVWVYPHRVYTSWSDDNYYHGMFYFDNHYFYADTNGYIVAANNDGTLFQQISTNSSYLTGMYIDEKNSYALFGDERTYYRTSVWLLKKIDNKYRLFGHILSNDRNNYDSFTSSDRMAAPMKIKEKSAPLYAYGFTSYDNSNFNYFRIYYGYIYTFMSTINNLSAPVTKTNGQTMKITYDIIQVED